MEYLDIIDIETDSVVGKASHDQIYEKNLAHRIVHVIVYRSNGNIVLQKRSKKKYFYPNTWTTSACGHVESWESYEQSAIRETQEEIWIIPNIQLVKKAPYLNKDRMPKMLAIFKAEYDGDFVLNFEVSEVTEFTLEEIKKLPKNSLHPELIFLLEQNCL